MKRIKLYCRQCNGKAYKASWSGEIYYVPTFMGEIASDPDTALIYRPPSKCKVCKTKSVYIRGIEPEQVDLKPEEALVVIDQ